MNKFWAILFILFFSLNSAIITSYFFAKKKSIKKEMKGIIARNINLCELEKITVDPKDKNFIRVDEKEFKYFGKLYDIVKEYDINGKIVFYCINDKKEESLMRNFSLFEGHKNLFNLNFSIGKILNYSFIPLFLKGFDNNLCSKISHFRNSIFINFYNSVDLEQNTPPPKANKISVY